MNTHAKLCHYCAWLPNVLITIEKSLKHTRKVAEHSYVFPVNCKIGINNRCTISDNVSYQIWQDASKNIPTEFDFVNFGKTCWEIVAKTCPEQLLHNWSPVRGPRPTGCAGRSSAAYGCFVCPLKKMQCWQRNDVDKECWQRRTILNIDLFHIRPVPVEIQFSSSIDIELFKNWFVGLKM